MNVNHFSRLQAFVEVGLGRFGKMLDQLDSHHFPSSVASELIEQLQKEIEDRKAEIRIIEQDFPLDSVGASQRLRSEHRKLLEKLQYIQAIENARTDEVPWSLIPSIERLAALLISDRKVLTTSIPDLNYQIRWNTDPPNGLRKFFILYLPKTHRANAFLHLLIGHELFHPLLNPHLQVQKSAVLPKIRNACIEFYRVQGLPNDVFKGQRIDQLIQFVTEAWLRGLTEVMCDLGAVILFGPSAILSMSAFAMSQSLDERPSQQGQFYPPWRLRIRQVLEYAFASSEFTGALSKLLAELQGTRFADDANRLTSEMDELKKLAAPGDDVNQINGDPLLKVAYECLQGSIPEAWTFLTKIGATIDDRWTQNVSQIPQLLAGFELLMPPGEFRDPNEKIGKPSAIAAIANAAWIYQLRSELVVNADDRLSAFKRTCRLALKAFEDSELKRSFLTLITGGSDVNSGS